MNAIDVNNLSKSFRTFSRREGISGSVRDLFQRDYRDLQAVDSISFTVKPGELIGYIGPNGAGKSTSIKMLTGILKPTSGEMKVLGFDPFLQRKEYTRHIGVVFGQRTQLWWDIAVIESLKLLGHIYQVAPADFSKRLENLTGILGMEEFLHTPVRKLSLGQRIRSDLAASLIHNPQILFLDEPTIGLDAVAKDSVRTFLRHINREFKTTILLTTHDLKEIEELCDRMLILDKGKIVYDGSLYAIKNLPGLERQIFVDFKQEVPLSEIESLFPGKIRCSVEGARRVVVTYDQQLVTTPHLAREILSRWEIRDLTILEPDIEDVIRKVYRDGMESFGDESADQAAPAI
ncbi:MAG: ATP-binding cassette domain-containing protein [Deltaproteobacteria bacterium]|nr:ATP-binding cassette domain-containing protein [Deltaproteobacteria bacterium]